MYGMGLQGDAAAPTSTSSDVRSPTSTRSEVRSPTSTSTEVRSPTSTSTEAYTQGNFTSTVTGGAGAGATYVTIHAPPMRPDEGHQFQTQAASYYQPEPPSPRAGIVLGLLLGAAVTMIFVKRKG